MGRTALLRLPSPPSERQMRGKARASLPASRMNKCRVRELPQSTSRIHGSLAGRGSSAAPSCVRMHVCATYKCKHRMRVLMLCDILAARRGSGPVPGTAVVGVFLACDLAASH